MNAPTVRQAAGFHHGADAAMRLIHGGNPHHFAYTFENFSHPYVEALISQLNRTSVAGMLDPNFLKKLEDDFYFSVEYPPHPDSTTQVRSQPREIDLAPGGAYSTYNWELFYHIPVAIAVHLSKNQRFAEAQRWFHYVFDPTCTDPAPAPQRWWKFLAFRHGDTTNIEALLELLGTPDDELTPQQVNRKQWVHNSYAAILSNPFDPHAVARARPIAYQYYVVMQYLSNLIAWGDSLFLQYTIETVNEASMHYVLAANILGPRPEKVPQHASSTAKSFAQLKKRVARSDGKHADRTRDADSLQQHASAAAHKGGKDGQNGSLYGIGESLYFCVPRNDTLLRYWDTVADRLFKIRHCMDITGVVRPLALWDPPIDPGMLIKARAAGLDIGSIVSGLNQPVGPLRSLNLIQKALELCGELKIPRRRAVERVREGGRRATRASAPGARDQASADDSGRALPAVEAGARGDRVSLLNTRPPPLSATSITSGSSGKRPTPRPCRTQSQPDRRKLTEENFDDAYSALVERIRQADEPASVSSHSTRPGGGSPSNQSGASGSSGQLFLTPITRTPSSIPNLRTTARIPALAASVVERGRGRCCRSSPKSVLISISGVWAAISIVFGGSKLAVPSSRRRCPADGLPPADREQAGMTSKTASYERRADDWRLQANLAAHELMQMGRQIIASLIAEQVAEHEYESAKAQVANSQEVDQFLRSKFTNAELYGWMQGEITRIYYQFYRFAVDIARRPSGR